jgi:alkylhydroperoxidase family enzyme
VNAHDAASARTGVESGRTSFLDDPEVDEHVARLYTSDVSGQGYVSHLTRVWAHSPEALGALSYILKNASIAVGLDDRTRALLVTACAATIGDSYCSLAFGSRLAREAGDDVAAAVLLDQDSALSPLERTLVRWTRRVSRDPSATTVADVDQLRALGYSDRQIFAITLFIAMRLAFSTVNDALGATPDIQLTERVPAAVRSAVTYGRTSEPADAGHGPFGRETRTDAGHESERT